MSARVAREQAEESAEGIDGDAEAAYMQLKQQIVSLQLRPGTTVREAELQEQLGLRRTPLREALRRLAHDEMLQIYPRHGIVIANPGMIEMRAMFEARVALESAVAGLAAQRRTAEELAELERLHTEMRTGVAQRDFARWQRAHAPFHALIVTAARNRLLEKYVMHHALLNTWLWNIYEDARGERTAAYTDHSAILQALRSGDASAAQAAMQQHVLEAKERLISGL